MSEFGGYVLAVCVVALLALFGHEVWQDEAASAEASQAEDPDPYFRDDTCHKDSWSGLRRDDDSSYEIEIRAAMKLKPCIDLLSPIMTKHVIFVNRLPEPATVCVGRHLTCSPAHPEFQLVVPPGERVTMDLPTPVISRRGRDYARDRAYPIVVLAPGVTAETVVNSLLSDTGF